MIGLRCRLQHTIYTVALHTIAYMGVQSTVILRVWIVDAVLREHTTPKETNSLVEGWPNQQVG